jgi:hypothetical protein
MMLWTYFMFLIVLWMAGLVIRFGGSAVPMVAVLATAMVVLKLVVRRTSIS